MLDGVVSVSTGDGNGAVGDWTGWERGHVVVVGTSQVNHDRTFNGTGH